MRKLHSIYGVTANGGGWGAIAITLNVLTLNVLTLNVLILNVLQYGWTDNGDLLPSIAPFPIISLAMAK
ncbi:MAG: hypothetical protein VKJ64_10940 [Leptolyngbyaceae bacterium]|nr:hypothetical protein [Leptolyngbyaceae bacterium]